MPAQRPTRVRPTTTRERRLIAAARGGDPAAQAQLLALYEPMARSVARRLYLPGADRDDLAQEARVAIADAARTWDPAHGVPFANFAWICATRQAKTALSCARSTKHLALNRSIPLSAVEHATRDPAAGGEPLRARTAEPAGERIRPGALADAAGDRDPVAKLLAREQLRAILARAGTLSMLERRALGLAASDYTHRDIADALHVTIRGVNNALQRARHKLREPLAA